MNKHVLLTTTAVIRLFGCEKIEVTKLPPWDNERMKEVYGGKGAGLIRMADYLGLPVPPGFTIPVQFCEEYYANGKKLPRSLKREVRKMLKRIEKKMRRRFGDTKGWPLLLSVRSGARRSMPGMMNTVLNLGLNDETVQALARASGDPRFAYDSYRQYIAMYGEIVLEVPANLFTSALDHLLETRRIESESDLDADDLKALVEAFKNVVTDTGKVFPQDLFDQLMNAIVAVFDSWMCKRAVKYRSDIDRTISEDWYTAVSVMAMVFGNMDETSATGVAFSRNPSTGKRGLYGDWLPREQGEKVVAGTHETHAITEADRIARGSTKPSLETAMPKIYAQLRAHSDLLEHEDRDMQDMEFTVEQGKLWMLQHRKGKRTALAAIKVAVDMADEGLITEEEAVCRVDPASLDQLLHPILANPESMMNILTAGLAASPGAVSGEIVFNPEEAEKLASEGKKVILVRIETSPEDIGGMHAAEGILTARGGMTSHAAVVARGMGKPCVSAAKNMRINYADRSMMVGSFKMRAGSPITICGTTGKVFIGKVATINPELPEEYHIFMGWEKSFRQMRVYANAETTNDVRTALRFGAEGIGLARTEHMFFEGDRVMAVREMMLADDEEGRRKALAKLLPMQRADFKEIFEIMAGLPVTIRLLDAPLHEFLPNTEDKIATVAKNMGVELERLRRRAQELHESNPMLGFRGVRLSIVFPEIIEMQARAIFKAATEANFSTDKDKPVLLEIMVPLILSKGELDLVKGYIMETARAVEKETGIKLYFHIGAMIELPRAALLADKIAQTAEFLSFGTNDLTQATLGISRDDAGTFLPGYVKKDILPVDPFVTIDRDGVGKLIKMATELARVEWIRTDKIATIGVCGEHGGDQVSIEFFEEVGLDYVSCSPYRVPIARLAAAQATIGAIKGDQTK